MSSFSLGGIFLNRKTRTNETTIKHEYGHSVQQSILGHSKYIFGIFIPSSFYNLISRKNANLELLYYSMPWERTADLFGNVNRGYYADGSLVFALIYLFLIGVL